MGSADIDLESVFGEDMMAEAKLRAHEVYLIALAIEADPCDLFEYVGARSEAEGIAF